jgi:hypothetical protein
MVWMINSEHVVGAKSFDQREGVRDDDRETSDQPGTREVALGAVVGLALCRGCCYSGSFDNLSPPREECKDARTAVSGSRVPFTFTIHAIHRSFTTNIFNLAQRTSSAASHRHL